MKTLRFIVVVLACATIHRIHAQATGLNLPFHYAHPLVEGAKGIAPSTVIGLGIQHDFDRRIGMGVDVNYGSSQEEQVRSLEVIYSAKFFATDNDRTAVYIGSLIGFQRLSGTSPKYSTTQNGPVTGGEEYSHIQIPIGLRAGLRGGLQGYFGELFAQVGYALGNGELYTSNGIAVNSAPIYFSVGFSFLGFGWE